MKLSKSKNYYSQAIITKVTLINKDIQDIVNKERRRSSRVADLVKQNKVNNQVLKVLFIMISNKQLAYIVEKKSTKRTRNYLKTLNRQSSDERLW